MGKSSSEDDRGFDHAVEVATENGWEISLPGPRDLFIDIDSAAALEVFDKQLVRFRRCIRLAEVVAARPSKSGAAGRYHIVVRVTDGDPLDPLERISYQLMLGSDPTRELLSWMRVLAGMPHPTLFFELPGVADPQTVWDQGE